MAKVLSYEEMFFKLRKRFPNIVVKDSNKFSKDYDKGLSFWLPNANEIPYTNVDKNVLCSLDVWIKFKDTKLYDLDVYIKFDNWCKRYGWYASTENYTLQIFKV
jgi:hypothetical protein